MQVAGLTQEALEIAEEIEYPALLAQSTVWKGSAGQLITEVSKGMLAMVFAAVPVAWPCCYWN